MNVRVNWSGSMPVVVFVLLISGCSTPSIVATRSIQLGDAMNNANKYKEAINHYEEYLAVTPQLGLYRNPSMEAEVCRKLAHAYATQGNYRKAEEYLQKAISLDSSPTNTDGLIEDFRMKGMLNAFGGNYKSAINNFNESLALSSGLEKSLKDEKKLTIANTYLALSQVHLSIGNYKDAEEFSQKSLTLFSTIPQEFTGTIEVKLVLSILHRERNNLSKAAQLCEESRQLAYTHQINTARQDQVLGEIHLLKGDFEEGIRYKLLALEQAERSNIKPQIIVATMRLGDAYRQLGDEKKANSYYQRAIQLQAQLEGNPADSGISHSLNLRSGDMRPAYNYYMQSGSAIGAALVCLRLGSLRLEQHDIDSAVTMFTQANEYFKQLGHIEGIAKSNVELASALIQQKDYAGATELLDAAFELTIQSDLKWQIHFRQGILFEEKEEYDSAYDQYLNSIRIINEMRGNLTLEEFKTMFANSKVHVYDRMIMLLLKHSEKISRIKSSLATELAFLYNEESRSRAFLDMLGNKKIDAKSSVDEIVLEQEQLIRLKVQRLSQELSKNSSSTKDKQILQAELKKAQEDYDHLLQQIKLSNPAYSSIVNVNPFPVRDIQGILDEDTAILEYWVSGNQVVIWMITKAGMYSELIQVTAYGLKREVTRARSAILYQYPEERDKALKKLYSLLISPFGERLAQYQNLIIIPHRNLHFLPFHALINPDNKFLIEEFIVQYAPSSSVLYYCVNRKVTFQESFLGLALGNLTVGNYSALPGTEVEVNHLSQLYHKTDIKTNKEFSESYLKDNIHHHGYVHLATHGSFNQQQPLLSFLLMSPTDEDDGRLTVEEIFGLSVQSKVVTLSACETGLGDLSEGDDLVGLSRAFMYAGAPGVIVSLWKVDDATTAWLMVRFYQYLEGGITIAESLTRAQRDLIQRNFRTSANRGLREIKFDESLRQLVSDRNNDSSRNPYYWAPFILIGNGWVK